MLIADIMPVYHFREYHAKTIHGSGSHICRTARHLRFSDAPLTPLLFRLRGIPRSVSGMEQLEQNGVCATRRDTRRGVRIGSGG